MKTLSIKSLIDFRRKSIRSKQTFASNIKLDVEMSNSDGGGDYWVFCLSAIGNSYKSGDLKVIKNKIFELENKLKNNDLRKTRIMYERNIAILRNYKDFDFNKLKPSEKLIFHKKHIENSVLNIKGLQIQVKPHYVFSFQNNGIEQIGAIWFIAKLDGFKRDELGMFADILNRYLKINYSKDYELNPNFCLAVDVVNNFNVNYSQLQKKEITTVLNPTIDEIKKLM